jgi:hypothetical protein
MDKINSDIASIILGFAGYFQWGKFFDVIYPGCRQQCYNMNISFKKISNKIVDNYKIEYRLFGKLHRENDQPAIIYASGTKFWYYHGKQHRSGDKPAIEHSNGYKEWYNHGQLHREDNKPAVIWADGSKSWYVNGRFIRETD